MDFLTNCEADQDREVERRQVAEQVRRAVDSVELSEAERFVLEHRLMAVDGDELSLAEIARRRGVSREWARQLELRVKRKLRGQLATMAA